MEGDADVYKGAIAYLGRFGKISPEVTGSIPGATTKVKTLVLSSPAYCPARQ